MRKLMAVGLMLCILTVFVSGASAAPAKGNSLRGSASLSEYAIAYATPSSEGTSFAAAAAYTGAGIDHKGVTISGATVDYLYGGEGSTAISGQTVSGNLYP